MKINNTDYVIYKKYVLNLEKAFASKEETCCKNKIKYKNGGIAEKVALDMSKKYKSNIEPYPCPYCHRWHVGNIKE